MQLLGLCCRGVQLHGADAAAQKGFGTGKCHPKARMPPRHATQKLRDTRRCSNFLCVRLSPFA